MEVETSRYAVSIGHSTQGRKIKPENRMLACRKNDRWLSVINMTTKGTHKFAEKQFPFHEKTPTHVTFVWAFPLQTTFFL
jgi:hypothetical protein